MPVCVSKVKDMGPFSASRREVNEINEKMPFKVGVKFAAF